MKRVISLFTLLLLLAGLSACSFSFSTANITDAVMSKDVTGDNFDPVDPTTTFAPDQPTLHLVATVANAPSDTKVQASWVAVDIGDVADPNTVIDSAEVTLNDQDKAHFTLSTPSTGTWPVGKYKVDLYLDGKLTKTVEFSVA